MDGLFADVLNACIKDARQVGAADRYRVLASQAVVLARLAGFLAGQLDLRSDPLRTSIEALMDGYQAGQGGHDGHAGHAGH
jgi:Na+-translocating ferredoxin:NAD+ oxidoreductase RNF subunit RnfB